MGFTKGDKWVDKKGINRVTNGAFGGLWGNREEFG